MPKGPKGEKRPADVIGAAVKVMKIATGEIEEDVDDDGKNKAAVELGRKGGKARASKLTAELVQDLENEEQEAEHYHDRKDDCRDLEFSTIRAVPQLMPQLREFGGELRVSPLEIGFLNSPLFGALRGQFASLGLRLRDAAGFRRAGCGPGCQRWTPIAGQLGGSC